MAAFDISPARRGRLLEAGLLSVRTMGRVRTARVMPAQTRGILVKVADRETDVQALAQRLGVSRSLLYMYVTRDDAPTEAGRKLLEM